jgi:hypothetical protein
MSHAGGLEPALLPRLPALLMQQAAQMCIDQAVRDGPALVSQGFQQLFTLVHGAPP